MSKIYTRATELIGNTPLLLVENYAKDRKIKNVKACLQNWNI